MNRTPDVIVVGAGLAGLCAALFAVRRGKSVKVLTFGAGALSIGGGCIDLLGYLPAGENTPPQAVRGFVLQSLPALPPEHPYSLAGEEAVHRALEDFITLCGSGGLHMARPQSQGNHWVPTIMGTLKPTYLCPPSAHVASLYEGQRILVAGVSGIKDCRPGLIVQQLQRYPALADKKFSEALLPSPLGKTHRSITSLDVARFMDTPAGLDWCVKALSPHVQGVDTVLLPPICGTRADSAVWRELKNLLNCAVVEMLSIPPGVGGLRLRSLLMAELRAAGVDIVENTRVTHAATEGGHCTALVTTTEDGQREHHARAFIVATGGVLGGGIATQPGKAAESIFRLPVDAPEDPAAWSGTDIFGRHPFAHMGVRVNRRLAPVDAHGTELLHNVHFAGRSLGGYDFAAEKSGNGVALVTGWHAAQQI